MEPAATTPTSESACEDGARAEARSNIFVVATVEFADACGPVRIRNMSPRGALIEGGGLPTEGSQVRLSRGSLSASAIVAWRTGNRAGIRFDAAICVADWLSRGPRAHQQKVDQVVCDYKSGVPGPAMTAAGSLGPMPATDLRDELLQLEQALRGVAEDLARDSLVCERHLTGIQMIDVAAQKLAVLAAIPG